MKKAIALAIVFVWTISISSLQGCATDTAYNKGSNTVIAPVKVVRYETPGILRSTATETFFLTTVAVALPGGSALLLLSDEYAKAKGADMQMKIPDFGALVQDRFVDLLNKENMGWPGLTVEKKPVGEEFSESGYIIELKVDRLAYGYLDFVRGGGNGFLGKSVVTMKAPGGEVLWQKSFTYLSKDFERDKDIDAYEADNGKLLKEEIAFAAEKTATDFIKHFKGEDAEKIAKQTEIQN